MVEAPFFSFDLTIYASHHKLVDVAVFFSSHELCKNTGKLNERKRAMGKHGSEKKKEQNEDNEWGIRKNDISTAIN